jgi:Zn-dependent peptidase ImmA (M78 family)
MEPRIDQAKAKAKCVLEELEVFKREDLFDLAALCAGRGVCVREEPLKNFEGLLLRHKRTIVYRDSIPEEGRKRFTIAHELGHWEMHPELNQIQACTTGDIHAYRGSAYELEANAFAAALLMPDFMLTEQLKFAAPTIATIKKLANYYCMSLTASAVRLAEFSNMPIIVAFSTNSCLKWYVRSRKAEPYFFKKIGSQLDGESLARTCMDTPDDPTKPELVDSSAWFPDDFNNHRFQTYEESVELGAYGVTLSILTIDE